MLLCCRRRGENAVVGMVQARVGVLIFGMAVWVFIVRYYGCRCGFVWQCSYAERPIEDYKQRRSGPVRSLCDYKNCLDVSQGE